MKTTLQQIINNLTPTTPKDQLKGKVIEHYKEHIREKLTKEAMIAFDKEVKENNVILWPYLLGSFDSAYFSWVDFFKNIVTGFPDWTDTYLDTHELGLIYPLDDVVVVSQKPNLIKKNENGLHNETGPALTYNDGVTEIYALNGVRMKKDYVMTPANQLKAHDIITEVNVEIRRELIRKVGLERVFEALPHKVIHTKGTYELMNIDLSEEVKNARYLKMVNPSIGVFHLEGVDPSCNTVNEAINWRASGDKTKPWNPSVLT